MAERPFAVIKQQFGVRQFLLRGLSRVRTEWRWLATAFNLERLPARSRAGPSLPPTPGSPAPARPTTPPPLRSSAAGGWGGFHPLPAVSGLNQQVGERPESCISDSEFTRFSPTLDSGH